MRKLKVDGKMYEVNSDELRHYDSFIYKGELFKHAPVDTNVVGYIVEGDEHIGVCTKSMKKLLPVLYGGIGTAAVAVIAFGVFVFNQEYHVNHWTQTFIDGGDGSGELDDGTEKVNKKFSYNKYATFDGDNVTIFYDTSYSDAEIALRIDGKETQYLPASNAFSFPVDMSMDTEQIKEGSIVVRRGSSIEEYPMVVERLQQVDKIELALGTDYDREVGYNTNRPEEVIEQGHYEEPVSVSGVSGNTALPAVTDDGVRIDFENFSVITRKKGNQEEGGVVNP